jgi:hypothetical protein
MSSECAHQPWPAAGSPRWCGGSPVIPGAGSPSQCPTSLCPAHPVSRRDSGCPAVRGRARRRWSCRTAGSRAASGRSPFSAFLVSDLDQLFCHPEYVIFKPTRIHHLMIMVSSVSLGPGWASGDPSGLQRVPQKPHNPRHDGGFPQEPTDDTAHSGTLVTSVKGTENGR